MEKLERLEKLERRLAGLGLDEDGLTAVEEAGVGMVDVALVPKLSAKLANLTTTVRNLSARTSSLE